MSVNQAQRYATHSMRDPTGTARTAGLKESNPVHGSVRSEMSNHLSEVGTNERAKVKLFNLCVENYSKL